MLMPSAAASLAATASAFSTAASSQLQAIAICRGSVVTQPWVMSSWMMSGIFSLECASLYSCNRRVPDGLRTRIIAPIPSRLTRFVYAPHLSSPRQP